MGRPMLRNLLKAGHTVIAYGRTPATLDSVVADGASTRLIQRRCRRRARKSLSPCSPTAQKSKKSFSASRILSGAKPGSLIVDMSSISPLVSQKSPQLATPKASLSRCAGFGRRAQGHRWHPRHHGRRQARSLRQSRAILKCLGSSVTLTGPSARATPPSSPIRSWSPATSPPWARRSPSPRAAASILKSLLTPSKADSPAAPSSTQRALCSSRATSSPASNQPSRKGPAQRAPDRRSNHVYLRSPHRCSRCFSSLIANGKGDLDHSAIATFVETASPRRSQGADVIARRIPHRRASQSSARRPS